MEIALNKLIQYSTAIANLWNGVNKSLHLNHTQTSFALALGFPTKVNHSEFIKMRATPFVSFSF